MPMYDTLKILAFDTSSTHGSIALLEGSELHAELKLRHLQNHSANLISSIYFLLNSLNWQLKDLNLVASGIGPGSFTGIRIGIATGLGIAQSLKIPFVGISGLEALGFQTISTEGCIGVLLNAQREQVYYAEYRNSGNRMYVLKKPSLVYISELPRLVAKRRLFLIGDTALCPGNTGTNKNKSAPQLFKADLYLATAIGRRALTVKRRWKSGNFIQCEPLYIRPPDAIKQKAGRH